MGVWLRGSNVDRKREFANQSYEHTVALLIPLVTSDIGLLRKRDNVLGVVTFTGAASHARLAKITSCRSGSI